MKTTAHKPTNAIVAYYRVSTKKQSLGLTAQRNAVEAYAVANNLTIVEAIEEKESGKECDRPGLSLAMATARKNKATLVVAKADRLSRDLAFATYCFFKSGVTIKALNLPAEATDNALLFGVYFGLAHQEAKMISERTKAALAELKAKGVKLGRPNAEITPEMVKNAAKVRKENADTDTANLAASAELKRYFAANPGKRNLSRAAQHLNDMQIYTRRGLFHTAQSVKRIVERYAI